ncbi:hypothetical protein AHF37_10191 [Paragonimus kellicotti]|nr:hypothetical protein AHF37_10191 [Paragonimus kellicotti]
MMECVTFNCQRSFWIQDNHNGFKGPLTSLASRLVPTVFCDLYILLNYLSAVEDVRVCPLTQVNGLNFTAVYKLQLCQPFTWIVAWLGARLRFLSLSYRLATEASGQLAGSSAENAWRGGFVANFLLGGLAKSYGLVMEAFQEEFQSGSAYLLLAGGLIYTLMYCLFSFLYCICHHQRQRYIDG